MPGARIESGDRVTLRTLEREDIPFLQRGFANPELRYPIGNQRHKNRTELESQFEEEDRVRFLVCLEGDALAGSGLEEGADDREGTGESKDGGRATPTDGDVTDVRPIGVVSVAGVDWHRPELAFWLAPEVQGRGYAKEAVSLVIDYIFRVYETPAVGAGAYAYNEASRGLLESLGFTEEGRLRKFRFIDGEHRDSVEYGLLRSEWAEGSDVGN
ncbi:GNAT family N-acetyltransferase [Halobacteria archaeon AArc-m2/3/4]|uniref:GNAT family N-acetyltransferase n=1 Tax=Natronoglomus mannanivorans TaxID=2979990 RepID=A0ABT2QCY9_9EURY|nr:GNAT family N-acetyltransferase [Halobacteria archaeon AArc-m2/3/4]